MDTKCENKLGIVKLNESKKYTLTCPICGKTFEKEYDGYPPLVDELPEH